MSLLPKTASQALCWALLLFAVWKKKKQGVVVQLRDLPRSRLLAVVALGAEQGAGCLDPEWQSWGGSWAWGALFKSLSVWLSPWPPQNHS